MAGIFGIEAKGVIAQDDYVESEYFGDTATIGIEETIEIIEMLERSLSPDYSTITRDIANGDG